MSDDEKRMLAPHLVVVRGSAEMALPPVVQAHARAGRTKRRPSPIVAITMALNAHPVMESWVPEEVSVRAGGCAPR